MLLSIEFWEEMPGTFVSKSLKLLRSLFSIL